MNSQLPTGLYARLTRSRRATALLAMAATTIGSQALAQTASARTARSSSGGAALGGSGTATGTSTTSSSGDTATGTTFSSTTGSAGTSATGVSADVVALDAPLQASGAGITLTLADFGTLHKVVKISGSAPTADAGATVEIEVASASGSQTWIQATSATVGATGAFTASWIPSQSTTVAVRALLATSLTPAVEGIVTSTTAPSTTGGSATVGGGDTATAASGDVSATSVVTLPIFTDAIATFYGPGLWGRHTACGEILRRATLGVASRTLKCGTMVAVQYGGRELSVPVIDRGPFANHASWDLTQATARLLAMRETATVGTLSPAPSQLLAAVRGHR